MRMIWGRPIIDRQLRAVLDGAPDGVLIECESVSLSRSVPWVARPIVGPIANRIARESLERTLRSLRAFLVKQP